MKRARWQVFVASALFAGVVLGGVLVVRAAMPQSPGYHLLKKVVLSGEGGWDYFEVDSQNTHRVFIPRDVFIHTRQEAIDFFDAVPRRGALKYDPGSFTLLIFGR